MREAISDKVWISIHHISVLCGALRDRVYPYYNLIQSLLPWFFISPIQIIGGLEESRKFLKALKLVTLAESLGGYESLAELPYLMTHASVEEKEVQL